MKSLTIKHKIRRAHHEEFSTLIQIWEDSVMDSHQFLTNQDIADYKSILTTTNFYNTEIFLIEIDKQIKGFIGLMVNKIQLLFIAPQSFGMGLGTALINFAIDNKDVKHVDVNEQNITAHRFYLNKGFRNVEKFSSDATGKPYPVISMVKPNKALKVYYYLKALFEKKGYNKNNN